MTKEEEELNKRVKRILAVVKKEQTLVRELIEKLEKKEEGK